jgi:hypothetical protein
MRMFVGLDVGFKRTAVCVIDERGEIVSQGLWTRTQRHSRRPCGDGVTFSARLSGHRGNGSWGLLDASSVRRREAFKRR